MTVRICPPDAGIGVWNEGPCGPAPCAGECREDLDSATCDDCGTPHAEDAVRVCGHCGGVACPECISLFGKCHADADWEA